MIPVGPAPMAVKAPPPPGLTLTQVRGKAARGAPSPMRVAATATLSARRTGSRPAPDRLVEDGDSPARSAIIPGFPRGRPDEAPDPPFRDSIPGPPRRARR